MGVKLRMAWYDSLKKAYSTTAGKVVIVAGIGFLGGSYFGPGCNCNAGNTTHVTEGNKCSMQMGNDTVQIRFRREVDNSLEESLDKDKFLPVIRINEKDFLLKTYNSEPIRLDEVVNAHIDHKGAWILSYRPALCVCGKK